MPDEQEYPIATPVTPTAALEQGDNTALAPPTEISIPVPAEKLFLPWLAALASQRIPYRVEYSGNQKVLLVPVALAERANYELAQYEKNTAAWQRIPALLTDTRPLLSDAGFFSALFFTFTLMRFHLWSENSPANWQSIGAWDGRLIRAGQWWRCLTALTLHADYAHLLTNMIWGGALLALVASEFGAGWGMLLMLTAGTFANALNALLLPQAQYQALGASTMVFALLGILSVATTWNAWQQRRQGRGVFRTVQLWLPILAGIGMLSLYGTAPGTDLGGHLNGFLAGLLFGFLAKKIPALCFATCWQWVAGLFTLIWVPLAWFVAWLKWTAEC